MRNYKLILGTLVLTLGSFSALAVTRTADPAKIDDIVAWAIDGETTKIIFPAGDYEFYERLIIENDGLILEGSDRDTTILKLMETKSTLIDAVGNDVTVTDLTLDGGNVQDTWAQTIFRFKESKGHSFERVLFENSLQFGIGSPTGWATEGLTVSNCEFVNISNTVIHMFNRHTIKRGELVTSVEQIIVEDSIFREGYDTAISFDAGNDRRHDSTDEDGNRIGRRYVESTSMSTSVIRDNVFEKARQFHIGAVQAADLKITRNEFAGMSDDANGGANSLHFEQFTKNVEIYDNKFFMQDSAPSTYPYISVAATEGHKRVTQERPSDTYATWTYKVDGSSERRADTSCATTGHVDKDCKRDVHIYGVRDLYIAGNTFNDSTKISSYLTIKEGENVQVGTKKDGTVNLNSFIGGDETTKKITLSGNDEGSCDVHILEGQNIVESNVNISSVSFDLPACKGTKAITISGVTIGGDVIEIDSDKDGIFDSVDPDDDNDGVPDESDAFPLNIKYAAAGTTFRFDVTDDADVDSSKASTNLGAISVIKVFVGRRHGYMKFKVAGLDTAEGDLVDSQLWLVNHGNKPIDGQLDIHSTGSDWDESTVTWNTKNDLNSLVNSVNVESDTRNISVDLSHYVTSDGFYSFGVTADVDGQLYTKEDQEGLNQPYIVVTFAVPSADFDGDDLPDLVDPDDDNDGVDDENDHAPLDPTISLAGDLDGNGKLDASDASLFRATLGSSEDDANFNAAADMDKDGVVTRTDYSLFIVAYRNQSPQ
ncbi:CBM96 family carbohydrate-binding protein [Paraglaciecola sp.]|uniref:CBM96 family carbohydrate-binding protein n=1 Tax=Paraglaciecola sp. TaxID=1920173 RepID=UPI003EF7558E